MISANIPTSTRKAIYRRDGYRCALCDSTQYLQITISSRAEKVETTSLTTSSRCAPNAMEPLTDASPRAGQ